MSNEWRWGKAGSHHETNPENQETWKPEQPSESKIKVIWYGKLTWADFLAVSTSIIPHSASWAATFSLLIDPTQGLCIPNQGATDLKAILGMCQKMISGTLWKMKGNERFKIWTAFNPMSPGKQALARAPAWCGCRQQVLAWYSNFFWSFSSTKFQNDKFLDRNVINSWFITFEM